MLTTFDIFMDSPDAQPVWIESVQDLGDARARLRLVSLRDEIASFIQKKAASWKSLSARIFRHSDGVLTSRDLAKQFCEPEMQLWMHVKPGTYPSSVPESRPSTSACHSSSSVG